MSKVTTKTMNGITDHKNQTQNHGHGIISQNCVAEEYSESGVSVKTVHIGTFVQVHSVRDDKVLFCIVRDDMQAEVNKMICKTADILNVPENLWGPLFTVEKAARLSLVRDNKRAESIGNISVGDTVQVLGPDNSVMCFAEVAFRNSITRLGVGIYFGLRVLDSRESLEKIVKRVSLLEPGVKGFPRGCDIVVTVDKIRPSNCNFGKERTFCHFDKEYKQWLVKTFSVGEDVNGASFHSWMGDCPKEKLSFSCCPKDQQASSSDVEVSMSHSYVKKLMDSDVSLNARDKVTNTEKCVSKWIGLNENSSKIGVELDPLNNSGMVIMDTQGESLGIKYQHAVVVPSKL